MSVPVAAEACLYTPCTPSNDRMVETTSIGIVIPYSVKV